MNSLCVPFSSVITFILIKGLSSYGPGPQQTTLPPNTTWLSSSEEEKMHFSQVDHVLKMFTLPGTVEERLLNYTIIDPGGFKDRLEFVKRFYRGRRKKYWNNKTKKWERFNQRLARVNEAMQDEIHAMTNAFNQSNEPVFHESRAERKFAEELDWYPEQHDVDKYEPDYSGDKIVDDYEVKRKKRGLKELNDNVSNHQKEKKLNEIIDKHGNDKEYVLGIQMKEQISEGEDKLWGHRGHFSSGVKIKASKVPIKNRRIKRSIVSPIKFTHNNLLKSLKYLTLRHKLAKSFDVKHDRDRRAVSDDVDDVPSARREIYKDYKSDWPYAKYDSNIHFDQIIEMPERRPHSINYSKLHTPEASIFNSFYNDDQNEKDVDRIKLKNLYRSMEYWTFTDPMNKYTSSPRKKYDKPRPTFGRNAATISVGASRFKLFNRNWYNEYKHRVHKRDTFGFSPSGGFINTLVNYASKIGDIYNTIATIYFKSVYRYMANMYFQSYLGNSTNQVSLLEDPDYTDALEHMGNFSNKILNWSSNLSNTILNEGTEMVTQYIYLNWYTEKYSDNSTQFFCDYENDTYKFVNGRLKLYNKTSHQLAMLENVDDVNRTYLTNESIVFDRRTKEPPKLHPINRDEVKELTLNASGDGDVYTVVKNISNPDDNFQMCLHDMGQPKLPEINEELLVINATVAAKTTTPRLNSNEEIHNNNQTDFQIKTAEDLFHKDAPNSLNQSKIGITDYQDDILDKAADFVLSFFINNRTAMETTTDDYTEMTNDLFDKIESKAKEILNKMSTAISSSTISPKLATESSSISTAVNLTSIRTISSFELKENLANKTLQGLTDTKITNFFEEKKTMDSKSQTGFFKSPEKMKTPSNHLLKDYSKIRSKRSLASRCLKGIQFVGLIFRPVEKQIVKVLDGIFGPYSSEDGSKSDEKKGFHRFSEGKKPINSDERIVRNRFESGDSSPKEWKSFSGSRKDRENGHSVSEELRKSRENNMAVKTDSALDSSAAISNLEISTRKPKNKKKKHKRKHKTFDNLFEDKIAQKSEVRTKNKYEKPTDETADDQPLPSFVKNPTYGNQQEETEDTTFSDNEAQNPNEKNQHFENPLSNNTFQDYNDPQIPFGRNQAFGDQMENNTFQDYNDLQNQYGRNKPFRNQLDNNTFTDYDNPQNPYGRNQPFGNQIGNNEPQNAYERNQPFDNEIGNNTFTDYQDPQNPYGRNKAFGNPSGNNTIQDYNDLQERYGGNQIFGNQLENNTFQDFNEPQNPYGRNQPFRNQIGNNTFQDYNDLQSPYGRNQPFGNQMGNNTFQDYNDPQNMYERNQPFENQMGNKSIPDYSDPQNPYGRNQPFAGNQLGNNTFQDYNDLQNPYGRNQPFGDQMGNNTFHDYYDPQNMYGRNQLFGNQMGNKSIPDYNDPQNPYGRNQPFGNQLGNNTFQDYNDLQNPNGRNQPFGNQIGNNTFQDYNDPQNPFERNQPFESPIGNNTLQDYNDPQNVYGQNQQPFGNQMGGSYDTLQNYSNPQNPYGNNQKYGNQIFDGNLPGQGSAIAGNNQNNPGPWNSPGSRHQ